MKEVKTHRVFLVLAVILLFALTITACVFGILYKSAKVEIAEYQTWKPNYDISQMPGDNPYNQKLASKYISPEEANPDEDPEWVSVHVEDAYFVVELTAWVSLQTLFYDYKTTDFGLCCVGAVQDENPQELEHIRWHVKNNKSYDECDSEIHNGKTLEQYTRVLRIRVGIHEIPFPNYSLLFENATHREEYHPRNYPYKVEENFDDIRKMQEVRSISNEWVLSRKTMYQKNNIRKKKVPTDSEYFNGNQWAIDNINLPDAWDVTTGSTSVLVGIIDSGIYAEHLELNGKISTQLSRDFFGDRNLPLVDEGGHGTKIAGIIGAKANNVGMCGVCWNISLVSLRIDDDTEHHNENVDAFISAIAYANQKHIKILNFSGGWSANQITSADVSRLRNAILNYNGLLIVAAGNSKTNIDTEGNKIYPASLNLDNIITVGGSKLNDQEQDDVYSESCYGANSVDLFAPAYNIHVTTNTGIINNDAKGTSLSAAFVTGVAALIASKYPFAEPLEIKYAIMKNVDKSNAFSDKCVSGGRLNASSALREFCVNHVLSYEEKNSATHVKTCSLCGFIETLPHDWVKDGAYRKCTKCTYSECYYHNMAYTYQNNYGHVGRCNICGYSVEEPHNWAKFGPKLFKCGECGATAERYPVILGPTVLGVDLYIEDAYTSNRTVSYILNNGKIIVYCDGVYYLIVICQDKTKYPYITLTQ